MGKKRFLWVRSDERHFFLCSSPENVKPLTKRRKYEEIINAKPFIIPVFVENT